MRFPLIVYKDDSSDYAAFFPDFPGCYTMAPPWMNCLKTPKMRSKHGCLANHLKNSPHRLGLRLFLRHPKRKVVQFFLWILIRRLWIIRHNKSTSPCHWITATAFTFCAKKISFFRFQKKFSLYLGQQTRIFAASLPKQTETA